MKRIGRGNADRRWDVLPQQPALAYDIAQNRLIVTAAMLQAPVLDMSRDGAAHYGSFGALVGHELTHAIDGKGRLVDAAGNLRDWWTPAESTGWDALGQRVAVQYGGYDYPALKGIKLNGQQTREANVADIAGVELAWDAYNKTMPAATVESKQAFFQGWAQLWAQQLSPEAATERAASNVHAPGQWRVNGTLQNLPAFGEAFACKVGTPMQPRPEQQVKVWP
jgi:putative endopeptidase